MVGRNEPVLTYFLVAVVHLHFVLLVFCLEEVRRELARLQQMDEKQRQVCVVCALPVLH